MYSEIFASLEHTYDMVYGRGADEIYSKIQPVGEKNERKIQGRRQGNQIQSEERK